MLPLPPNFVFSQSSLQAYADCPRRFWLAYVAQLPWPAIEASPVQEHEAHMRQGATFHRLVERTEIGIAPERVAADLHGDLALWYDAYQRFRPNDLPVEHVEIERVLAIPFVDSDSPGKIARAEMGQAAQNGETTASGYRLAAKYDLIAAEQGGRVVIVDWKTARRRSDPATLRFRLQTIVYPYVLVEASSALPWGPVRPEQVEMRYWFTAAPSQPVVFRYDAAQHEANRARLAQLLKEILAGADEAGFPKVPDTIQNRRRFCAFCVYRSRCNRGESAGNLDELDDPEDFFAVDLEKALEFTLDEIEELAF
ncbi:MAG: PD-(D/E)XK nuclease family protein [Caldilineaceae bacterium]|nr:PD-(D/E)XK nuclease family protein [Caldilineaceae bacterium]